MRFLFLTTKYHKWMASDLAEALVARGHSVDAMLLDWNAEPGSPTTTSEVDGVKVVTIAPRATRRFGLLAYRISKMLLSSRHANRELNKHFDPASYNALVAFTPASTLAGPLRKTLGIPARILFIFDFYPIMQREIGMIPDGPIFRMAMRREERLYRGFTALICNLAGNIPYLRKNYRLAPRQHVTSNPLWSDITPVNASSRDETRTRHDLPLDRPIAIFGGQITDGRGVEFMLDAARHAQDASSPLLFLFVGEGRLAGLVDDRAREVSNVRRIAGLDRETYLKLASACDIGLVATVPGVSSFNFPTKTIDYLRAGLPVVAAVEPGSDYVNILTTGKVGDGVDFTDAKGFFQAASRLLDDPEIKASIAKNAQKCLEDVFDVAHAADKVIQAAENTMRKNS